MDTADRPDNEAMVEADDAFWELVAEKADCLGTQWRNANDSPPSLSDLLEGVVEPYQRPLLIELIKVDLEFRWSGSGQPRQLEDYLVDYPLLGAAEALPTDLIFEEYQIRNAAGNRVSLEELGVRFPAQRPQIDRLAGTATVNRTIGHDNPKSDFGFAALVKASGPDKYCEGDTVDDFDLLLLLGAGSFARVFLARQKSLERLLALKISSDESQEPRTLAQLDHPNIVRVFDQRSLADEKLRLLYMELVPGGTLSEVIELVKQGGFETKQLLVNIDGNLGRVGAAPPLSSELRRELTDLPWPLAVCRIGAQIADGLSYAHEKGVLHRDIKPANVLLTAEATPKLADFNVSFNAAGRDERPSDTFGGSLAYMSPEQLRACHTKLAGDVEDVGEGSDIYSLGLILVEMLTGERVFQKPSGATDWEASLMKMLQAREQLDREIMGASFPGDCPPSVKEVVLSCLAKKPQDRPRTAAVLGSQLRMCLHPRLWTLLHRPMSPLGRFICRNPLVTLLLATLLPMIPVAVFNFRYNHDTLASRFAEVLPIFDRVQLWINSIGFPLGAAIGLYLGYRAVYRWPRGVNGKQSAIVPLLHLGRNLAALSMTLWFVSGIAFPLSLHLGAPDAADPIIYTLFMLSLTLCGLVAGTYPYLLDNFIVVRFLLPATLLRGASVPPTATLQACRNITKLFVALTAVVPMLAILLAVVFQSEQQLTLVVLCVAGILGFLFALFLGRAIDGDLAAYEFLSREEAASWEPS